MCNSWRRCPDGLQYLNYKEFYQAIGKALEDSLNFWMVSITRTVTIIVDVDDKNCSGQLTVVLNFNKSGQAQAKERT